MTRLVHLVRYLPDDGALARELSGGWSVADELAALSAEIAFEHYRAYLSAHGVRKSRLPAPLRIPRPHRTVAPPRPRRAESVAEVLAVLRAGHKGVSRHGQGGHGVRRDQA